MDREAVEKILTGIGEKGLFQSYGFCRNGDGLCLLGGGSISYVYEVYARKNPGKTYALKIIGLKGVTLSSAQFQQMVSLQQKASESSGYVAKILACEEIVLPAAQGGLLLQCVLMEKLECLITVTPSGQAKYLRRELENIQERLTLFNQIAEAVLVLHRENILHRDIKLENIFFNPNENCYKLGDFSASAYTETGSADAVVYTNGYGAPEIAGKKEASYEDTADIYSLGIVMYLLLNQLKFPGAPGYRVNPAQYTEEFVFPACEEGSTEWTNLIRKMCSYQREQRYQSMEEVSEEMHRITDAGEQPEALERDFYPNGSTVLYRSKAEDEATGDDRYEKKGILHTLLFYYESRSKWYGIALSVLFALLLGTMLPELPGIKDMGWMPQLMLCLAVINIILLHFGELYLLFGIGALTAGICFMSGSDWYVLYAVLLLGILYGIPVLGAAGVAGVLLWNLMKRFGWEGYLAFLTEYCLEWILVTLIMLLVNRIIMLRRECAAGSRGRELWERSLYHVVPVTLLVVGIIYKHTGMIRIPGTLEVLGRVHPGRVGCLVLAVNLVDYLVHRNYPRLGEYMWNEYLDKRGH